MGHFCLTYRDANRLVGVVIIEASSLPRARMNIAMRSVAVGAPFAEGHELSVPQRALVPASQIGRVLFGVEAAELLRRLEAAQRNYISVQPSSESILTSIRSVRPPPSNQGALRLVRPLDPK
jgi:hypothetical protein